MEFLLVMSYVTEFTSTHSVWHLKKDQKSTRKIRKEKGGGRGLTNNVIPDRIYGEWSNKNEERCENDIMDKSEVWTEWGRGGDWLVEVLLEKKERMIKRGENAIDGLKQTMWNNGRGKASISHDHNCNETNSDLWAQFAHKYALKCNIISESDDHLIVRGKCMHRTQKREKRVSIPMRSSKFTGHR